MTPTQTKICEDLARWEGLVRCETRQDGDGPIVVAWACQATGTYRALPDYFTSPADTWRLVERLPEHAPVVIDTSQYRQSGHEYYASIDTFEKKLEATGPARLEALVNSLHAYAEAGGVLEVRKND